MKSVFVTGGNAGIGLALCRQLVVDHGCHVFMGSRNLERGATGLKSITDAHPDKASAIELVQIDVADDNSVAAAAERLKSKGVRLYALVNNALRESLPGCGPVATPDGPFWMLSLDESDQTTQTRQLRLD